MCAYVLVPFCYVFAYSWYFYDNVNIFQNDIVCNKTQMQSDLNTY